MIDVFLILFTGGIVVYIIVRAAKLDRTKPWYEIASDEAEVPQAPVGVGSTSLHRPHAMRQRPIAGKTHL